MTTSIHRLYTHRIKQISIESISQWKPRIENVPPAAFASYVSAALSALGEEITSAFRLNNLLTTLYMRSILFTAAAALRQFAEYTEVINALFQDYIAGDLRIGMSGTK